jgi:ubiquinone/menaquinone biosynthesis C-methylase UbiE
LAIFSVMTPARVAVPKSPMKPTDALPIGEDFACVTQYGDGVMTLSGRWEAEARNWIAWARRPGHDSYWRFHRDRFFELLPPAGSLVLDVGCGEGRFPRDLKARGYEVVGVDTSPTLIEHARDADREGDYRVADAADLPFADESIPIVTALLSLHDMDDMAGAVREAGRVLAPGGRLCIAVVHPINSAGRFERKAEDAAFVMTEPYMDVRRYTDTAARGGLDMTFHSCHRPLGGYFSALEAAQLLVERVAEVTDPSANSRWHRIPLFLHLRAMKLACAG